MENPHPHNPTHLLARLKKISSSVFADVMAINNVMDYRVKPVNYSEPLVGRVRTVSLPKGDNLFLHHAIYQVEPDDIIVVDGQDYKEAAYLGELMAGAAEALGVKGIVIDGFVRDKQELGQLKIQIYAKGFLPSGPSKEGPGSFDTTITCAGAMVAPFDYIVADEDGVVIIPREDAEEIVEKAEKKLAYERNRLEMISRYRNQQITEEKSAIEPGWLREKLEKYNL
ncbi:RraA family protein [Planococcus dechangensis]|uniref:Putative 4-hydroxy-4-methyl-2-oxoglutarate aldolase n=1 Tax=Planococcus dechangensis TaxID=1176255 RepID=A0ABV9MCP3_9BACL